MQHVRKHCRRVLQSDRVCCAERQHTAQITTHLPLQPSFYSFYQLLLTLQDVWSHAFIQKSLMIKFDSQQQTGLRQGMQGIAASMSAC
jgi:hypothetical protein